MRAQLAHVITVLGLAQTLCSQALPADGPRVEPPPARPLIFEANTGRYERDVAFVARGPGYHLFLAPTGSCLALRRPGASGFAAALRTRFVGADPAPAIRGESELPTRVHHLIGADASGWSLDNHTFARVRYQGIWPGVDLVLYESGGQLEYDFVVAPGADPEVIRLAHDGVEARELLPNGDLALHIGEGQVTQSAPVIYQRHGDERQPVAGRYRLHADGTVGFAIGAHDPGRPLVIDPVLVYASYLGGNGLDDALTDVATDAQGCAYVCGYTDSTDLPGTAGVFQPAKAPGYRDALVAKISRDGSTLLWCTYLGGSMSVGPASAWDDDRAFAIAVDAAGHAYVGGRTSCSDFPTTAGAFDRTYLVGYGWDGFVAKLTPDGSGLVYSTLLGNGGYDAVFGLDLDAAGHAYATGQAHASFPVTAGAFQTTANTAHTNTAFVAKIVPDGSALVFATFLGGLSGPGVAGTWGTDIHVDAQGRSYVAGHTYTTDFPTPNGCQTGLAGHSDGFLARLSADGSTLDYGTYLGGAVLEGSATRLGGVAADDSGRAWFVNDSDSADYPVTAGAVQPTRSGSGSNAVVTCIDTDASGAASLLWSTYFGSSGSTGLDVETDGAGNAYVLGHTSAGVALVDPWPTRRGCGELFVTVFDAAGNLSFSTLVGGSGCESYASNDTGSITLDADGNIYVAGRTGSLDLATPGAFQTVNPASSGGAPAVAGFVAKLSALSSNASHLVRPPCTGTPITDSMVPVTGAVLGQTLSVAIGDHSGTSWTPGGAATFWLLSAAPTANYPCGIPVSTWGEFMVSPSLPLIVLAGPSGGGAQWDVVYSVPIPDDPTLDGAVLYNQGLIYDLGTARTALTNALDLTLGK